MLISKMMKKIVLISVLMAVLIFVSVLYSSYFGAPGKDAARKQFVVTLSNTQTQIVDNLKARGFIKNIPAFDFVLRLRGIEGKIQPGSYSLSKSMNAWQIVGILKQGSESVWVTIPEGLRKEEIAEILTKNLHWTKDQEDEWIKKDTATSPSYFEGVYFPDTYLIPRKETPKATAERLNAKFEEVFQPYAKEAFSQNIKWTTLVTMASVVQREAAGKSDMPLVSGILWNRLLKNMRLQADATVQYARGEVNGEWWAPAKSADLKIDSPYNTYLNNGLPPHPIANPGIDAIKAALYPQKTDCLYYIHDKSGDIHCAVTYEEHQKNINKYLR